MKYILLLLSIFIASPVSADCVVLMHGLTRSSGSFLIMETALKSIGYDVVNTDYPSTEGTIEDLAGITVDASIEKCGNTESIHFVTHSLGGILVRYYMEHVDQKPINLGHVVMLAPPNKGSPLVDELGTAPGFELWHGVAGTQLGTETSSVPNSLGAVDYSVGIIAGNQSIAPHFSKLIDGEDDGKVSVESTKVEGMSDHIVLPVTHTFMMNNPEVFKQVAHYLREGKFKHKPREQNQ